MSHNGRMHQALIDLGYDFSRFSKRLDRKLSGVTLDNHVSNLITAEKGQLLGTDEVGGTIYSFSTRYESSELLERILVYWHDQLALITLKYIDRYRGGWNSVVEQTIDKYGTASKEGYRRAIWNDGKTVLVLDHDLAAHITVSLSDLVFALRYFDRQKSSAPKLDKDAERYCGHPSRARVKSMNRGCNS